MKAADLQRFCADEDDLRWYICKPWSRGDWTYATNGHILIRVPRLPDVEENEKAPNSDKVIADAIPAKEWLPVPQATMPPDLDCEDCDGTGQVECNKGFDHDCENCGHTGKVRQRIGMNVAGTFFDQGYLSLIQGWEIAPAGDKFAAHIRNADATGLIMPRREK